MLCFHQVILPVFDGILSPKPLDDVASTHPPQFSSAKTMVVKGLSTPAGESERPLHAHQPWKGMHQRLAASLLHGETPHIAFASIRTLPLRRRAGRWQYLNSDKDSSTICVMRLKNKGPMESPQDVPKFLVSERELKSQCGSCTRFLLVSKLDRKCQTRRLLGKFCESLKQYNKALVTRKGCPRKSQT